MSVKKGRDKTLAEQIAELEDPTPKEFDPEDQSDGAQESDSDSGSDGVDLDTGREHYEAVSKSKLRKAEQIELGSEYAGSRVSRHDLNEYDSSGSGFLEEGESEGTDDGFSDGFSASEGDEDQEMTAGSEADGIESYEDDESGSDVSGEDNMEVEPRKKSKSESAKTADNDREELRRLMASGDKIVTASISQAAKADAVKGAAVKQQRLTFDALLNSRIKLQKGLTLVNGETLPSDETENLIKSAEMAGVSLWNMLGDLRQTLAEHQTAGDAGQKKRKRPAPATVETSSADIWSQMCELEAQSLSHRRGVLDKWSRKVRGARSSTLSNNNRGKLLNTSSDEQSMTTVLETYVSKESRGDKSSASNTNSEARIAYDDTAFYQSLLRDLVEQRMAASANGGVILDSISTQLPRSGTTNPITGMRKDKVKRTVDTKASKGRKMKYNVHEKLQNFMAPEDRGSWSNRARDEFFASLLGRSVSNVLGEDEDSDNDGESVDDDAERGLRLFRS
ncbi:Apoptosis-antagonizing transcription factor, C-terminal [Trichophyton interdigitale]|uniref:Protein BFR2 n=1 Tax=Trichophyton interdigitale TaxID=101480 RepID=A0A9P4YJE8_9EURO|nr:Apoptosis-antagonizing transcription factor, C-terminal [Trichophyton interdigitale]KAF3896941.1 Apoptosis-antagonizing transcription factor, C-terminal [Trichophyton interdigitale]KAG8209384.1 Apoptosis-antagonizing transcription factor, C-terminal [Trichophyton interdigitale]